VGNVAQAVARPVPPGFFGIVPQGPLLKSDFDRMHGVVGTLRIPILWSEVEPRPGEYRFSAVDETIVNAAVAGVRVLPFVYSTPSWLSADPARPPIGSPEARRAWTGFLRKLVMRYGPRGDLWRGRGDRLPIRRWQIWNEPNFVLFWRPRPSPRGYARLLRSSARAIRGEDPQASIVTAGVAPVESGMRPWSFLRKMYKAPGVGEAFDFVGLHPYAPHVRWIAEQVQLVRQVMEESGDGGKPLLLTEIGVASGGTYPNAFDKGVSGQASFLRRTFRLLMAKRRAWRIDGVDWFTWQDSSAPDPHCVFCEYGGLFDAADSPKPAWWALRRVAVGARASVVR
jgi:polysaccharide biosynthesis protein PslG